MSRTTLSTLLALVSAFLVSSCASGVDRNEQDVEVAMSDYQIEVLADGIVTQAEYMEAFRRLRACVSEHGGWLPEGVLVGTHINYDFPATEDNVEAYNKCYEYHYQEVDRKWQIENQDEATIIRTLQKCLTYLGINPSDTQEELTQQLAQTDVSLGQCLGHEEGWG